MMCARARTKFARKRGLGYPSREYARSMDHDKRPDDYLMQKKKKERKKTSPAASKGGDNVPGFCKFLVIPRRDNNFISREKVTVFLLLNWSVQASDSLPKLSCCVAASARCEGESGGMEYERVHANLQ